METAPTATPIVAALATGTLSHQLGHFWAIRFESEGAWH